MRDKEGGRAGMEGAGEEGMVDNVEIIESDIILNLSAARGRGWGVWLGITEKCYLIPIPFGSSCPMANFLFFLIKNNNELPSHSFIILREPLCSSERTYMPGRC